MDDSVPQIPTIPIPELGKHHQLSRLAVVLSLLVLGVIATLAFQNLKLAK